MRLSFNAALLTIAICVAACSVVLPMPGHAAESAAGKSTTGLRISNGTGLDGTGLDGTAFDGAALAGTVPAVGQWTPGKKTIKLARRETRKKRHKKRYNKRKLGRAQGRDLLANVKSWGYQLQGATAANVANSNFDAIVIDYARAGSAGGTYSSREMRRMKRKPDGSRRVVLAYISIGEAEDYRFYWRRGWVEKLKLAPKSRWESGVGQQVSTEPRFMRVPKLTAPTWLGRENLDWAGNFAVRFWDPDWQKIIFGSRGAYLERIIRAGFDGIYIDRVDAYYGVQYGRPRAANEMAKFVIALAKHARKLKPGFLIIPQNAEELLLKRNYLAAIDGIAKEDLFYGSDGDGQSNSWGLTRNSLDWLGETRKRKLPVFVVEYLKDPKQVAEAKRKIEAQGFISYFGPRSLDRLVRLEDLQLPPGSSQNGVTRRVDRE